MKRSFRLLGRSWRVSSQSVHDTSSTRQFHAGWKRRTLSTAVPLEEEGTDPSPTIDRFRQSDLRSSNVVDLDKEEATMLVDDLLRTTRDLMSQGVPYHSIAFSGGVDSSLVAALVHKSRGIDEQVDAILGISPAVPTEQIDLARNIAHHIGMTLNEVTTNEGSDDTYIANAGQACLACKTHLYSTLQAVVEHAQSPHVNGDTESSSQPRQFIYNGTNADDLQDPTRLGLIAADRFDVRSPIRGITKSQVRTAARHLGLPNWQHAASPCLRSRLALGVQATQDHLQRVERAERHVRHLLSHVIDETSNMRVRLLANNRACIEVDAGIVDEATQVEWKGFFQELGFAEVGVRAFKSGSVATSAP